MATITLITFIKAPTERCFLLSLSVDLHMHSTAGTGEKAIAGIQSGLMKLNDTVTWKARHFGIVQQLTSKITEYSYGNYFVDEMQKGIFKKLHHRHGFTAGEGGTLMKDVLTYEAPLGLPGSMAEHLFLTAYLRKFLQQRNAILKQTAESDDWKIYLNSPDFRVGSSE